MSNINPETDVGVQDKNQKNKIDKSLDKSDLYQDWVTAGKL